MMICSCLRCLGTNSASVFYAPSGAAFGTGAALECLLDEPDSAIAKASAALVTAISDPIMVRHCKRAYLFGVALADKASLKPDREVFYVACMLHDLGLEPLFDGPQDFETIGAEAAKRFLLSRGADQLADRVYAAIDLHTTLASADDPRPEVALLHMGTMMDVFGVRLDRLEPKLVQRIVDEFPRTGTKALIGSLLKHQIDTKPHSRTGLMGAKVDIAALINAAPFEDQGSL